MDVLVLNNNCCRKPYGFLNFLFDIFMICVTSGFWIIWIFVRERK